MDQFTRRIIGFGVHAGDVDGVVLYLLSFLNLRLSVVYLCTQPL